MNRIRWSMRCTRALCIGIVVGSLLGPRFAQAATCTWNGTTGSWTDTARWSCAAVPGAGDTAVVGGGTVTIASAASAGALTLSGGTINGAGSLSIVGATGWSGGTLAVATVDVGGGLVLSGSTKYLGNSSSPCAMNLNSDATWSAGQLHLAGNSTTNTLLTVAAGSTLRMAGDLPLTMDYGLLVNHGTFVKSAGTGTGYAYYVSSDGVVQASAGLLQIQRTSTLRGQVVADSGAVLETTGDSNNVVALEAAVVSGAGTFRVDGWTRVGGGAGSSVAAATTLHVESSTLRLDQPLTVDGPMTWSSGTISGVAAISVQGGLTLHTTSTKYLGTSANPATFNLNSDATWSAGQVHLTGNSISSSLLMVAAGSTLRMAGDLPLTMDYGQLVNHGTFVKSAGTGTGYAYYVTSDGVVRASTGLLQIQRTSTLAGQVVADSGAVLETTGDSNNVVALEAASVSGAGTFRVDGWTRVGGSAGSSVAATTTLHVESSTLRLDQVLDVDGPMNWSGGTIGGTAAIEVNGGLTLNTTSIKYLGTSANPATFNLNSDATWSAGQVHLTGNSISSSLLTVAAGSTLRMAGDLPLTMDYGQLVNHGTFVKSAGTGTGYAHYVSSDGVVQSSAGLLQIQRTSTLRGQVVADSGAVLETTGDSNNVVALEAASVSGAGTFRVNGWTRVGGAGGSLVVSTTTLHVASSTLRLDQPLTVGGPMTWSSGTISGTALLTVNGGLSLNTNSIKYLGFGSPHGQLLLNSDATWSAGQVHLYGNSTSTSVFTVAVGSTLRMAGDLPLTMDYGQLVNHGTFVKSAGTGTGSAYYVTSDGVVRASAGLLQIQRTSTLRGQVVADSGAVLETTGDSNNVVVLEAAGVSGAGTFRVNGWTRVGGAGGSAVASTTTLHVASSTLRLDQPLTVDGPMTWSSGTISGVAAISVQGGLTLNTTSTKYLGFGSPHGQLLLNSDATWSAGQVHLYGNSTSTSVFTVAAGSTLRMAGDLPLTMDYGQLVNHGTFVKSAGTGTGSAYYVTSDGVVRASAGLLQIQRTSTLRGQVVADSSAVLETTGDINNVVALEAAGVSGAGTFRINGWTRVGGAGGSAVASTTTLHVASSTLRLDQPLTVDGPMTWSSGTISGVAAISVQGGLTLNTTSTKYLGFGSPHGQLLLNSDATWSAGQVHLYGNSTSTSVFTVAAGSTLRMAGDLPLTMDYGQLVNHGTFVKSAGAGTGSAYYVTSDGVVRASTGTLQLQRASTLAGQVVVDSGAVLETTGGDSNNTIVFDGATASGTGMIRLSGYTRSQGGTQFVNLTHQGSRFEAGDTAVSGSFVRNGGTFEAGSATFTFNAGSGQQQLTLNVVTTFGNVEVAAGTLLVETVSADNATVVGTTRVLGTLRKSQSVTATGVRSFGLTGVRVNVDTRGGLSALQVDRRDVDHPAATYATRTGRNFTLTPVGGSYSLSLILPHTLQNFSRVDACLFDGAGWDCAVTSSTASSVTRAAVTALGDWAVGFDGGCTIDAECESFACVGGLCCSNDCTGTCVRCDQRPETCELVATGEDPKDECTGSGVCGGTCDGAGACQFADGSVECASASCAGGTLSLAATCSGGGACSAPTQVSCQGFACDGAACGTTCVDGGDCVTGWSCDSGSGQCLPLVDVGGVCSADDQCGSGSCAGGRCCAAGCEHADATCGGSCDVTGTCNYPTTAVSCGSCRTCDGQGACLGTPVDDAACGDIACDALDTTCADYADVTGNRCLSFGVCKSAPAACTARTPRNLGTSCATSTCASGGATLRQCDAAGDCVDVAQTCYPYLCSGSACGTTCSDDAQCASDRRCNAALGTCGSEDGDSCADDDQCGSGHCTDGVCCASACDGTCERCDATPGTCTAIAAGFDPDAECTGAGTCGGTCDGLGACQFPDDTVLCDLCLACDGVGACAAMPDDDPDCGTIACSALSTDCRTYSDLASNRCVAAGSCAQVSVLSCTVFSEADDGTACTCQGGAGGGCLEGECDCSVDAGSGDDAATAADADPGTDAAMAGDSATVVDGAGGADAATAQDASVSVVDAGLDASAVQDSSSTPAPGAPEGCGCASTHSRGAGLLLALGLALGSLVRRRRCER